MAAPQGPRRSSPRCGWGWVGPGKQWRGMWRTRFNTRGTNEKEEGGSKEGCYRCSRVLRGWGGPVPLSAGECSPSGQAHANHSHRWIPPDGEQCPIGEPPEPGPQTCVHPPDLAIPQDGRIGGWTQGAQLGVGPFLESWVIAIHITNPGGRTCVARVVAPPSPPRSPGGEAPQAVWAQRV